MRLKLATVVGAGLAALAVASLCSSAVAAPSSQGTSGTRATRHVQEYAISIMPSANARLESTVVGPDFAIAPQSRVRITFTNSTANFHTFSIPGLGVSTVIPPAHGSLPSVTTFAFTARTGYGVLTWYCVICKSGAHGPQHTMSGHVYAIVDPRTLAA